MAVQSAANASRFLFKVSGNQMLVESFTAKEAISEMFNVKLSLVAEEEVKFEDALGCVALLTMESEENDRYIHGMISEFEQTGAKGRFFLYDAILVPQMWSLTLQKDCRIFQNKSTPDIVKQVLEESHINSELFAFRLTGEYAAREYCVQYRETDFAFISRLLAEEGIFFFFEHSQDKEILVFGDSTVNYQPIAGKAEVLYNSGGQMVPDEESVFGFRLKRQIRPGKFTHTDYNFEKPDLDLKSEDKSDEHQDLEIYDYPGEFLKQAAGKNLAKIRLQQARMLRETADGSSSCPRLTPGLTFTLSGHDTQNFNQEYLVVSTVHRGEQPQVLGERSKTESGFSFSNTFRSVPSSVTIRPDGEYEKPVIHGAQTAIVTGPSREEIYPDKYGRVKVKFHWDRLNKKDENSSCWIRVSQIWAGSGWGGMFIPRIGQEVVVSFLEGDPDRPLITGRLYHGTNMPPYTLPDDKTKSTIKSDSSIGGQGCNEIRFEDKKGEEEVFIQAEKDMNVHVKNDQKTSTGRDCHLVTKRDHLVKVERDHHVNITQDDINEIGRDHHLAVKGKEAVKIDGTQSFTIAGDVTHKFQSNYFNEVANEYYIKGMNVVIEAMAELTIKAGSSFVHLGPSGVDIKGTMVNINSGGSPGSGSSASAVSPIAPLAAVTTGAVTAGMAPQDAAAHDAPAHQPSEEEKEEKSWVEIELVDEDGNPVSGEKYRITLPDGTTVAQGVTDEKGLARVEGIDPGSCKVTFPKLDKDAWEPG